MSVEFISGKDHYDKVVAKRLSNKFFGQSLFLYLQLFNSSHSSTLFLFHSEDVGGEGFADGGEGRWRYVSHHVVGGVPLRAKACGRIFSLVDDVDTWNARSNYLDVVVGNGAAVVVDKAVAVSQLCCQRPKRRHRLDIAPI